jgi:putative nucleotidyltransferase with HDIG domain
MTPTELERKTLTKELPLIAKIGDGRLKELVIEVWVRLWRESPYHDIGQAPNYLSEMDGDETLVRHTNAVVKMAEATAREFQQAYDITLNLDHLLAGALLHDVDKLVLYERKGDSVQLSELGRKVSHGGYGAKVAEEVGVPQNVANIIACHSPMQHEVLPATIEAVLVAASDTANFQSYRLMKGKGLWKIPRHSDK